MGLVGRGLRLQVWHGWVGVGSGGLCCGVGGLGLVGRSLCVRVWGGLGLVIGGVCVWVWGWWVGVGRLEFALEGLGLVG